MLYVGTYVAKERWTFLQVHLQKSTYKLIFFQFSNITNSVLLKFVDKKRRTVLPTRTFCQEFSHKNSLYEFFMAYVGTQVGKKPFTARCICLPMWPNTLNTEFKSHLCPHVASFQLLTAALISLEQNHCYLSFYMWNMPTEYIHRKYNIISSLFLLEAVVLLCCPHLELLGSSDPPACLPSSCPHRCMLPCPANRFFFFSFLVLGTEPL